MSLEASELPFTTLLCFNRSVKIIDVKPGRLAAKPIGQKMGVTDLGLWIGSPRRAPRTPVRIRAGLPLLFS